MIYELRTYDCAPGRRRALIDRFEKHMTRLFAKHGIAVVGYWQPTVGVGINNRIVYLCRFEDANARERAWESFLKDPEFRAAHDASEVEGGPVVYQITSELWTPLPFSPLP
jgi:hypothetical protein